MRRLTFHLMSSLRYTLAFPQEQIVGLISRHIVRETVAPFLLATGVISFVSVANELRERMTELSTGLVTAADIGRLGLYFLPTLVAYIVPVSYLMGTLLAFGALSQNNEITAMRAAGIPLKRIVLPVIVLGGLLSAFTFVLQDRAQPWGIRQMHQLIAIELPLRIGFDTIPTGAVQEIGDWRVYIAERDKDHVLHNVDIMAPDGDGRPWVYYADTARVRKENGRRFIELRDGYIIPPEEAGGLYRSAFPVWTLPVPDVPRTDVETKRRVARLGTLFARERELSALTAQTPSRENKNELRAWRAEIADRLSFPFACLAVSVAAAPLGVRSQRGGKSYGFAVGAVIFLVYFLLKTLLEPRSLHSLTDVVLRGMTPNIVLILAGGWFLWRVDRV